MEKQVSSSVSGLPWASPRLSSAVDIIHVDTKDVQVFISHARRCRCGGSSRSGRSCRSIRGICGRHSLVLTVRRSDRHHPTPSDTIRPCDMSNLLRSTCHLEGMEDCKTAINNKPFKAQLGTNLIDQNTIMVWKRSQSCHDLR